MKLGLGLTNYIPFLIYSIGILVAILSIFKPKLCLFFTIFLLPFRVIFIKLQAYEFGNNFLDILFVFIILGWILKVKTDEDHFFLKDPLSKKILLLLIVSFLSFLWGSILFESWSLVDILNGERIKVWKNYAMMPLLYFMTVNLLKTKKDIKYVVLLMIIALFLADYHYYLNVKDRSLEHFRWELKEGGIFHDLGGNELAAFFTHFFFLPLGLLYFEKNKFIKIYYFLVISFTLYPILYLFSRGAYLGLLMGLIGIGILKKSKTLIVVVLITILSWQTLLPSSVVERIQMTESENGEIDPSAAGRLDLWRACIVQFTKTPILGAGFNTYKYFGPGNRDPHNEYVKILSEQGIIGIWLFISVLYFALKYSIILNKKATDPFFKGLGLGISGTVIACIITNMFGNRWSYIQLGSFFFVSMALIVRANIIEEEQKKTKALPIDPKLI